MSEETKSNGNGATRAQSGLMPAIHIAVTDSQALTLAITGTFPSLDYALNMLAQATRELEAQWRLQRAALYQQQQIAAAQEAAIRADLQRRH
jgi:hypothetical protein